MPDPITATIVGGTSLLSGAIGSSSAKSAANAQVEGANKSAQLYADQFAQQRADQEPFRQAGITTQNELLRQLGLGGDAASAGYGNLMRNFGQQDFQTDPGYAFRLSEGLKAIDRTAAARGGMQSGGALKAAERYGQNLASDEYQNAYARYNQNRQLNYNMLSGQQAVGQGATNAVGAAGQNYANNAGEAYMGAANARASGYMGQANAWGNALGGIGSAAGLYGMGAFGGGGYGAGGLFGGGSPRG